MAYNPIRKNGMPAKKPGRKPDPNKPPKRPSTFVKDVPRPHVWLCGPDEYKHSMYTPWQRSSAQARYRGEEFEMTFEQFYKLWKDHWPQRGRGIDDLCMSRKDHGGPWSKKNTHIITRKQHYQNQRDFREEYQIGKKYQTRKATK
jgi:hypothetical protein